MDAVKEIRRRKGWSQKDLAEESGVGQDTISGIESGRHEPRPSTLRKLADALDVEVADFFREPAVPLAGAPETGPADLAQRREYAQRLMDAGVSEATAREVSGEFSRSEEYWRALAKYAGLSEASGPPEAKPAEALEAGPTEPEDEEERHVIPQSAASLKKYIKDMKKLKELREAEMEELGKGVGLRNALLIQMVLADKGLHDLLKELGVLDFAKAVREGREMAEPEAIPLCHELLRRLEELKALSAEAEVSSGVAEAGIKVEGVKGMSEIERQMHQGTLERRGTES